MNNTIKTDVAIIGAGIMSATLASLIRELDPGARIVIYESLERAGLESSNAMNNAGTGHAGLCELNYSPQRADGEVDISKAIGIFEGFEQSKQFWAYMVESGMIAQPESFIRSVPHLSFVLGEKNCAYLKRRYELMREHHFFGEMSLTQDWDKAEEWAPLLTQGRDRKAEFALTRVESGTDVNFGSLTRSMIDALQRLPGLSVEYGKLITDVKRNGEGWSLKVRDKKTGERVTCDASFVFLGAGGGALPLLQKSGIKEGKGFGGFPVSGQWLVCTDPDVANKHEAKIYGKAAVGAPPMSVPHLDTRFIDGKRALLFGPFAGFSPKFLKSGSVFDLAKSIRPDNLLPMLAVGRDNIDLTIYLVKEVLKSHKSQVEAVREFFPEANEGSWKLATAGQRVQIIKKDEKRGGVLQFGTEVVTAEDGSIAALLGASPGASTAVSAMLDVLERCFPEKMASDAWQNRLRKMIPSYGMKLSRDAETYHRIRRESDKTLKLFCGDDRIEDSNNGNKPTPRPVLAT